MGIMPTCHGCKNGCNDPTCNTRKHVGARCARERVSCFQEKPLLSLIRLSLSSFTSEYVTRFLSIYLLLR